MVSRVREFIREDVGSGDITSELVIPAGEKAIGRIVAKEDCVLAGAEEAAQVFSELGAKAVLKKKDGSRVRKGQVVLEVRGPARAILTGERLALNFIMRMSGIATVTNGLLEECRKANPKVRIAATRKTTPGFREFEKKAVVLGGGDPHRFGLDDAVLIKDNHISLAGGVAEALARAKRSSFTKKVEIEVEDHEQAMAALEHGADIVMLDNFSPAEARRTYRELKKLGPEVVVEISGGITPKNIRQYAGSADVISLGWITHSVKAADFSMDILRP